MALVINKEKIKTRDWNLSNITSCMSTQSRDREEREQDLNITSLSFNFSKPCENYFF